MGNSSNHLHPKAKHPSNFDQPQHWRVGSRNSLHMESLLKSCRLSMRSSSLCSGVKRTAFMVRINWKPRSLCEPGGFAGNGTNARCCCNLPVEYTSTHGCERHSSHKTNHTSAPVDMVEKISHKSPSLLTGRQQLSQQIGLIFMSADITNHPFVIGHALTDKVVRNTL
jgi:hypothetical protein